MYQIIASNKFKKDFNLCLKRGLKANLISEVILLLEKQGKLPAKYKPHVLKGKFNNYWECHIQPDWLLIWEQNDKTKTVALHRTGTHSDLF
ncbi:MAG: type II toxin-antitoxin system YafQ family toxin [Vicingaceae bacterium]|nr:type II toxin-antitoxin system YafQ family toxin [Vicingaceae bacterium]